MVDEKAWQSLAERYNLIYLPRHQWQKARVAGTYRGYQVHLSTYTFGLEIILTPTSPRPDPPVSPLALKDIHPYLFDPHLASRLGGYFRSQERGRRFFYHQIPTSSRHGLQDLQRLLNQLCDLADHYRYLLALGGEVVPILTQGLARQPKFSRLARQLLQDITEEADERLRAGNYFFICQNCWWRAEAYPVTVPGRIESLGITGYRCRHCHQTGALAECRRLICLLDERMSPLFEVEDNLWRVNWLRYRRLFDFEQVELIRTGDEAVEKFVVQVANNTEPHQKTSYPRMSCLIGPECHLAQNTLTLLKRTFGRLSSSRVKE